MSQKTSMAKRYSGRLAMNRQLQLVLGVVGVFCLTMGTVAPATADDAPPVDAQAIVATAPGANRVIAAPDTDTIAADGVSVTATDNSLNFDQADGLSMTLGLPANAVPVDQIESAGGDKALVTTQYTDPAPGVPEASVSARALILIPSLDAPSSYDFEVELPAGVEPAPRADGGMDLVQKGAAEPEDPDVDVSAVVGRIMPAWAVDANGAKLPTSYSFENGTLTQSIKFNADTAFPVVADPEVAWMGYFVRLAYSKKETLSMRDQGVIVGGLAALGAAVSAAAGPAAPVVVAALYAVSATAVGIIAATASNAVGDGKCLQLDVPSMYPSIVRCKR